METCEINALGVNSHNLTRRAIEAENFFSLAGGDKVDLLHVGGGDGFAVSGKDGAVLRYPHVSGLTPRSAKLKLRAASIGGATIKAFANTTANAGLLARCAVPSTGGLAVYVDVVCAWSTTNFATAGEVELVLVVESDALEHEVVRVDRIWLSEPRSRT